MPLRRKEGLGTLQTTALLMHKPHRPSHDCPPVTFAMVAAPSGETRGCGRRAVESVSGAEVAVQ